MLGKKIQLLNNFMAQVDERTMLLFLLVLFLSSFFFFFPPKTPNDPPIVKIFKRDGEPLVEIYEDEE